MLPLHAWPYAYRKAPEGAFSFLRKCALFTQARRAAARRLDGPAEASASRFLMRNASIPTNGRNPAAPPPWQEKPRLWVCARTQPRLCKRTRSRRARAAAMRSREGATMLKSRFLQPFCKKRDFSTARGAPDARRRRRGHLRFGETPGRGAFPSDSCRRHRGGACPKAC